jgi:GGDEF domain-containing protein
LPAGSWVLPALGASLVVGGVAAAAHGLHAGWLGGLAADPAASVLVLTAATLPGLALVAASAVVSRLLRERALRALAEQADAAGAGRLELRLHPRDPVLEPLARAMNAMVTRLAQRRTADEQLLRSLRSEVDQDPVTSLPSRVPFMAALRDAMQPGADRAADAATHGTLVLVRLRDLAGLNQRHGRDRGDDLLRSVGSLLQLRAGRWTPGDASAEAAPHRVARLNGADFGLLLPGHDAAAGEAWFSSLAHALQSLPAVGDDTARVAWIGATRFQAGEAPGAVLARADGMLQLCETADLDWQCADEGAASDDALDTGRLRLAWRSVRTADGQIDCREARVTLASEGGTVHAGDEVLAAAARCLRRADVDLRAVELALAALGRHPEVTAPAVVEVGWTSALRPSFLQRLDGVLSAASAVAHRLRLDIDVRPARSESLSPLGPLLEVVRRHGAAIGLSRVGTNLRDVAEIGGLGVTVLVLDRSMTDGIAAPLADGRRRLVALIAEVAGAQGVPLAAHDVDSPDDLRILWAVGLGAAGGAAVAPPALAPVARQEAGTTV